MTILCRELEVKVVGQGQGYGSGYVVDDLERGQFFLVHYCEKVLQWFFISITRALQYFLVQSIAILTAVLFLDNIFIQLHIFVTAYKTTAEH